MGKLRKVAFSYVLSENYASNICYNEVLKDWYLSPDVKRIKGDEMYKTYSMNLTVEKRVLVFDP
jgi:hypothetical protein